MLLKVLIYATLKFLCMSLSQTVMFYLLTDAALPWAGMFERLVQTLTAPWTTSKDSPGHPPAQGAMPLQPGWQWPRLCHFPRPRDVCVPATDFPFCSTPAKCWEMLTGCPVLQSTRVKDGGQGPSLRRQGSWEAAPNGTGETRPHVSAPVPLPHQASFTKYKSKNEIIETFRTATSKQ